MKKINAIKITEVLFFAILFAFSWWLMWKTFRVSDSGNLKIATKVWSDFGATIPLIRSFSYGSNFPPEYPIFPGPPIRYHFVFFALVGMIEKVGIPIDWALNSLSAASFFLLLMAIYFLSFEVFKKRSVSVISCLLFLFNGSFSFLEFFKKFPLNSRTLTDILHNDTFHSFGPYYGDKVISAFWSLNIFTNQRHLALAYASFLFFLLIVYKTTKKPGGLTLTKSLLLAIAIGLFPFIHLPVFMMMEASLFIFFVITPNIRKKILLIAFISSIIALPQIMYLGPSQFNVNIFHPGYLIDSLSFTSFIKYWFLNLGLTSILAPIGFLLATKRQRKVLLPFMAFFVIGNLFQFSPEIAANHKFFNIFVIGANIFTAFLVVSAWKHNIAIKILVVVLIFIMTLSGMIDIFPIKNDVYVEIDDGANNDTQQFIINNTTKNALFLNAFYTYDPASLAGRKIFFGWPYFAWSAGYDTSVRSNQIINILDPLNMEEACQLFDMEQIDYIEIPETVQFENSNFNPDFFNRNFVMIYESTKSKIKIYDVAASCNF